MRNKLDFNRTAGADLLAKHMKVYINTGTALKNIGHCYELTLKLFGNLQYNFNL